MQCILATLGDCSLRMPILPFAHQIARSCRYAQFHNVCAIILHVISTLNFCQTSKHRHEILSIWDANLIWKVFLLTARAVFLVCFQIFGDMQEWHVPNCLRDKIELTYNNKPCGNFPKQVRIDVILTVWMCAQRWFAWQRLCKCGSVPKICGRWGILFYQRSAQ